MSVLLETLNDFLSSRRNLEKAEQYLRGRDFYMALCYLQQTKREIEELIQKVAPYYDPITGQNKDD